MRNLPLLVGIILFWLLYGTFIVYVSQDPSLQEVSSVGTTNFSSSGLTSFINDTGDWNTNTNSLSGIGSTLSFMFGFGIGTGGMPDGIAVFLSAINWILLVVTVVLIWRLASPFSGSG
jgi:hypothetical protein